jgi:hypothetical protein
LVLLPVGWLACGTVDAVVVGLVGLVSLLFLAFSVGDGLSVGLLVGSAEDSELKAGWLVRVGTGDGNLSLLT